MSKTLFLSPPSFDGFDGGAGARYQARREVTSYWYPTWLAQPAALTPNSRLLDCPPHDVDVAKCLAIAKDFDHVIINTSTPSLKNDCKVAEAIKAQMFSRSTASPSAKAIWQRPGRLLKWVWLMPNPHFSRLARRTIPTA